MANNEHVNKVEFGDQTIMDISDTSATPEGVVEGQIFYRANGARSVGTLTDATQSVHGLMSTTDKTKLDGIEAGAQANPGVATNLENGLMSAMDKSFLNAIPDVYAVKNNTVLINSLSLGRVLNSTVGSNSLAIGTNVIASYANTQAFGLNTSVNAVCQMAIGQYNNPYANNLFMIGNGTSNNPNTIFAVDQYGNVIISGNIYIRDTSSNASGGHRIAPDWNEPDENNTWSFIKNKPFGSWYSWGRVLESYTFTLTPIATLNETYYSITCSSGNGMTELIDMLANYSANYSNQMFGINYGNSVERSSTMHPHNYFLASRAILTPENLETARYVLTTNNNDNIAAPPYLLIVTSNSAVEIHKYTSDSPDLISDETECTMYRKSYWRWTMDPTYLSVIPITKGGTGATSVSDALINLGLSADDDVYFNSVNTGAIVSGNQLIHSGAGVLVQGLMSRALANYASAMGYNSVASEVAAHAEGNGTTASAVGSHSEGMGTIANQRQQHVSGKFNVVSQLYSSWEENTSYVIGDKAIYNDQTYECNVDHTSTATFDPNSWDLLIHYDRCEGPFAYIIGNGNANHDRSNAFAVDWDGNAYLMGNVYVGANANSGGGTRLATMTDLQNVASFANATTTTAGFMSAADKTKLDSLETFNCHEYTINIATTDWSNNTYTWTNSAVTISCYIAIAYGSNIRSVFMGDLSYSKVDGGIEFTVSETPTGQITIIATIIDGISVSSASSGSLVQVQADWTESDSNSAAYILHKPDLSQYLTSVPTLVGATSQAAGTAGLVPAPTTSDTAKFLRGDGTWASVPNAYVLPAATASVLGGIKVGTGLSIDANGVLSANTLTGATSSTAGTAGLAPAPAAGDENKFLKADGTWAAGGLPMVILSYGNSTWDSFINAYKNNVIVYCRASSNSNPATGAQGRMAFMAYVNNGDDPTEVEFQYYRSVSSHTASQMGDQVFVYKLNKTSGWSVTTREASLKQIVNNTSTITVTWSSNKITLADA